MIIRSPPNRQRNVSHHGKENCRCIDGVILYNDDDHLNDVGAKILINDFINWVSELETKSSK